MEQPVLYASPEPYPAIQISTSNLTYAQLLSTPFSSAKSELTTITQYIYFNWVLEQSSDEISHLFLQIAKVEMHHLNLLGQLITALGGNPVYRSYPYNRPTFWNSGVLQYQCHTEKALHLSIASEYAAIEDYRHLSKLIQDSTIIAVLQRIILDEEVHIQLFQQYLTTK